MDVTVFVFVGLVLVTTTARNLQASILVATTEALDKINASLVDHKSRLAIDHAIQWIAYRFNSQ
jgi:hypothetical protein